jgi:hypothetical protein
MACTSTWAPVAVAQNARVRQALASVISQIVLALLPTRLKSQHGTGRGRSRSCVPAIPGLFRGEEVVAQKLCKLSGVRVVRVELACVAAAGRLRGIACDARLAVPPATTALLVFRLSRLSTVGQYLVSAAVLPAPLHSTGVRHVCLRVLDAAASLDGNTAISNCRGAALCSDIALHMSS